MTRHAVIIGSVWPEPGSTAAGQNMMGIIDMLLQADWQVTFLSAAATTEHRDVLSEKGVATQSVSLNCDSFNEAISTLSPDIVVFDRFMTEEQFSWRVRQVCPDAMLILNSEDLHCLRNARHEAVKQNHSASEANLNTPLAHREIAAILRCDLTFVISEYELALLTSFFNVPSTQLCYVPLMTEPATVTDLPFESRQGFVSIGNFRHPPNWDSVLILRQHIWPRVRATLPGAIIRIYGAYPPKKATQLHNVKEGFLVEGWATSAHNSIAQARVLLAPLRFGAGIKGKIVNAFQAKTPVVTTAIGAEGVSGPYAFPGAVCDDWDDFATHAVALHNQRDKFDEARRGMPNVLTRFNTEAAGNAALEAVNNILTNISAHRHAHFQQNMLWHHTLTSTQYMSQWIEAKNKYSPP